MIYYLNFILVLGFILDHSILFASSIIKPNIVLFMADDMGIGDTSAYKGITLIHGTKPIDKTLRTPNLDRFANQGIIFTDAHAPASMCSSTRYSLLTGRHAHRSYLKKQGWLPHGPNRPMIQRALTTLPEMLQRNGYYTGAIGKYHVGMDFDDGDGYPADEFDYKDVDFAKPILDGPTHHGFDKFFGVPGNTEDSLDTEPRIYIRNDKWTFTDRSKIHWMGMKHRAGQILSGPDWNLSQIGPDFLKEGLQFIQLAAQKQNPFFLYYVPTANHFQRNQKGDYAVPEFLNGKPVKGTSRYTDGAKGTEREDMVIENDIAFGALIEKLEQTEDPRNPGRKLIDNTLIIFTSDNGPNVGNNEATNQESGGLRGKKAKLWEGGHRVPFLLFWKGRFEGRLINRNLFALTDLFATFANLLGDNLKPSEAQDSLDSLAYWDTPKKKDLRARFFFCHLGPPYENDAVAVRKGSKKLIIGGGLVRPWSKEGARGLVKPQILHDLDTNPKEVGEFSNFEPGREAEEMSLNLLKIHNRGHTRKLEPVDNGYLILDDGWHNLRNDITGSIGYEFELLEKRTVTHLGMWDDHDREQPVRSARGIPTEHECDRPSRSGEKPRSTNAEHTITLWESNGTNPLSLASLVAKPGNDGELIGEFRYKKLEKEIHLTKEKRYILTLSTQAGDGDHFHDPIPYDGLSPLINPRVKIIKSVLFRGKAMNWPQPIPSFSDLHPDHSLFRLPVGPTLRFR
jgi:arylsulfatase A